MTILSKLIIAVATILSQIIDIYIWVVIISALITWVRPDPYNPIVQVLRRLTEPVYEFMRRYIPTSMSGVDLAPIILILSLKFINLFFVELLNELAHAL